MDRDAIIAGMVIRARMAANNTPTPTPIREGKEVKASIRVSETSSSIVHTFQPRRGQSGAEARLFLHAVERGDNATQRFAIGLFTGTYKHSQPHGTQLDAARAQAQRIVRPVAPKAYTRSPSVEGTILPTKGIPNPIQREIDHLTGTRRALLDDVNPRHEGIADAQIHEVNRQLSQYGVR